MPQVGIQLFSSQSTYDSWLNGDDKCSPVIYSEASIRKPSKLYKSNRSNEIVHVDTSGSVRKVQTENLLIKWFGTEEEKEQLNNRFSNKAERERRHVLPPVEL